MVPVHYAHRRNQDWLPSIFNEFFDDDLWRVTPAKQFASPAVNILENEKDYQVEIAAPGMTKEDFNVHLDEEGDLVINMEKKVDNKEKERKGHYLRREFSYTKFQQTMLLPEDANREDIAAKVEHGVLTVTIAKVKKVEPEKVHRQIEVQ